MKSLASKFKPPRLLELLYCYKFHHRDVSCICFHVPGGVLKIISSLSLFTGTFLSSLKIVRGDCGRIERDKRTHRRLVLVKDLIVLGHRDAEYDRGYVFEAMDPFLALASLAANVEQSVKKRGGNDNNRCIREINWTIG